MPLRASPDGSLDCRWTGGSSPSPKKRKLADDDDHSQTQPRGRRHDQLMAQQGFIQLPPRVTGAQPSTSHHSRDLHIHAAALQQDLETTWAERNHGKFAYQTAQVLLMRWEEDDLDVSSEITQLEELFTRVYGYDVESWTIPSEKPERALYAKVLGILDNLELKKSLLIFYYAGHAQPSTHLGTYPIWTS